MIALLGSYPDRLRRLGHPRPQLPHPAREQAAGTRPDLRHQNRRGDHGPWRPQGGFCMVPIVFVAAWVSSLDAAPPVAREPKVFARSNLVAWCIVPFDAKNRSPAERAEMVKQLGFTKV